MLGFAVGTICLLGLVKLRRMRRMGWAHHGHGFGGWGHAGGCDGRSERGEGREGRGPWGGGRRRVGMYALFEALDATPAQEKVILAAVDEVRTAARETRGEWKQSRVDLAQAFRADSFDAEIMGNAFARHDEHLERVRKAVVGAFAKVHDALDEKQRARLAEWMDAGGFGDVARGFGIYR